MAKKRYLYANKKPLHQEDDFNYFYSPKYAKTVAERYGWVNRGVEDAFKKYFDAMKHYDLTKYINKDMVRRNIDNMTIQKYLSFDEMEGNVGAMTGFDNEIMIRNSFKKGDFSELFHEFNHLILLQSIKISPKAMLYKTGFNEDIVELDEEQRQVSSSMKFLNFNEAVTELLAEVLLAKIQKKSVLNKAYFDGVGNAKMLYNIVGPSLFRAYLQGDFNVLEQENHGITRNQFEALAEMMDNKVQEVEDYYNNDFNIKLMLISMLEMKIKHDAKDVNFDNYIQLEKAIGKAYAIFAGSARFSDSRNSIETLYNKDEFLDALTESFVNTVVEISDEKGFEIDLYDEVIENYYETFKFYNENEYFLVHEDEPYVDLEDFKIKQYLEATNPGKAEYMRKKGKVDCGIDHNITEQPRL